MKIDQKTFCCAQNQKACIVFSDYLANECRTKTLTKLLFSYRFKDVVTLKSLSQ